ncbi:unnamed protein product [Candida verbasci]|uniref:Uncharacterized protein n=1 Tax=Candida verbasci TaxID=1227364 RepID=A0A9W4TTS1_9ASCO|nr:unnamed protein product [Candida verbasci]
MFSESIDYHNHLPPYRSLLNPNARYDYKTHTLIPLSQNDLNRLQSLFRNKKNNVNNNDQNNSNNSNGFKMKYKSLLSDVGRSISLRISNSNLLSNTNLPSAPTNGSTNTNFDAITTNSISSLCTTTPIPNSASSNVTTSSTQHSSSKVLKKSSTTIFQSAIQQQSPPVKLHLKNLPIEILDYIMSLVDSKNDYKSCLYTCQLFYVLAKPYYYENLQFNSTYRFAQFITYLRLNSDVGQYVKTIDLSNLKPGYDEDEEEQNNNQNNNLEDIEDDNHDENNNENLDENLNNEIHNLLNTQVKIDSISQSKIYAGWRDWKFKNNPLYTIHPYPSTILTKTSSNSQYSIGSSKSVTSHKSSSSTSKKFTKPFKYFKTKKRSRSFSNSSHTRKSPRLEYLKLKSNDNNQTSSVLSRNVSPHPLINKFLLNYSTSKDVPIGYVLHLMNLCPNIISLNLGNLSLSIDYEVSRSTINKYQNFDLMNNYSKDLIYKIDNIMRLNNDDSSNNHVTNHGSSLFNFTHGNHFMTNNFFKSNQSTSSTTSSIYSVATFSKPIRKYNSLLPPLPPTIADISYLNKGDGKVYLSDLNLKSINNLYLKKINEEEILSTIIKIHGKRLMYYNSKVYLNLNPLNADIAGNLKYINLSSMIWLNRTLIENFLKKLLTRRSNDLKTYGFYDNDVFSYIDQESESEDEEEEEVENKKKHEHPIIYKQDLIIDFTDSGMYKNLQWAKRIDLNTFEGCKLANKIIKNEINQPFEEFMRRERQRRGRIGENYLA